MKRDPFDYGWFYEDGKELRVWEDRKCPWCKEAKAEVTGDTDPESMLHYYHCPGCDTYFVWDRFWNEVMCKGGQFAEEKPVKDERDASIPRPAQGDGKGNQSR